MKKLTINWADLEMAFDNSSYEIDFYLDTETGQTLAVTDEARSILRRIVREYGSAAEDQDFDLAGALVRAGTADWLQQEAIEAGQIEADLNFRYLEIPKRSSRDDYLIMRDFIATVENEHLADRLWEAISGRGAFRFFRSVLAENPNEEARWYAYREQRLTEEILEWLEMEEIEPANLDA